MVNFGSGENSLDWGLQLPHDVGGVGGFSTCMVETSGETGQSTVFVAKYRGRREGKRPPVADQVGYRGGRL